MNLPKEFCTRMKSILGDEYDLFIKSYSEKSERGIRINTYKCKNIESIAKELGLDSNVDWCASGYYADDSINGNHPYHAAGLIYFQEPSAMCAAEGLPLSDGMRILDLCAAPGGKTTQIAARMNNKGLLVSNEIIKKRAAILAENTERMGLTNTIVTNEAPSALSEKFALFFDGIIVDAPCSGEGMFKKEPKAIDEWSAEHSLSCVIRQKNILDDAYKMLKPGGYLMYSTCTFSYDENESVVQYMVEKYNMEICEIPCLSMLSAGIGNFPNIDKCRRVFPHRHRGEGHFAALLRKSADTQKYIDTPLKRKQIKKKDTVLEQAVKLYREFENSYLKVKLDGYFVLFGENLYLLPEQIDIDKLKILRCGLHLGTVKRGRFEPAHALSHAFNAENYINSVDFNIDSPELKKYMLGDIIQGNKNGWCVITVNGYPIGWGKCSSGIIKNHYPKALRLFKV